MLCPYCQEKQQRSRVTPIGCTVTQEVGQYWDEDGTYVDPNVVTNSFECSQGHRWDINTNAATNAFISQVLLRD